MTATIVSFWEGHVSWLERLSFASMIARGHRVRLFVRDVEAMRGAFDGVEIFDVRDVLADRAPAVVYRRNGLLALYADIVRIALLRQERSIWCDADCVLLNTLEQPSEYLMGWLQEGRRVNNAVLAMPQGSALLEAYWSAIAHIPVRVPWATPRVRLTREIGILFGRELPADIGRMSIGPRALTYFVKQLGLERFVAPRTRFYPFRDSEARLLLDADDRAARAMLGAEADVVHAWHGKLKSLGALESMPPRTSWLGQACRQFGVVSRPSRDFHPAIFAP